MSEKSSTFVVSAHVVQKGLRFDILLVVEILQRGLVFLLRIAGFQQTLVFPTTRQEHHKKQKYVKTFTAHLSKLACKSTAFF